MTLTHGSLFSGIGGFDLAAEWMGWENKFHCEINQFGRKVLNYYWPKAKSYDDIKQADFSIHQGSIDILTGGFPCQPFSNSGKREGKNDERHLWPKMLEAIRAIKPRWVVGENVSGIITWSKGMVFREIQNDLEVAGYKVQTVVLPAIGVGLTTSEKGYGLLPTPMAWDGKMYKVTLKAAQNRLKTQKGPGRKLNGGKKNQMTWIHHAILFYGFKKCTANPQFSMWTMGYPLNWTELPFQNGLKNQSKEQETQ